MNKKMFDILEIISKNKNVTQRELAKITSYSLGVINNAIKNLIYAKYINNDHVILDKALKLLNKKPKSAIILAAGFGTRMIPINMNIPKGLLEVHNEKLIERLIKQLHEVGIFKIYVVVGYMKEKYEYLIDKFNVELIVNTKYKEKSNLYSLYLTRKYLKNSYIVPCDIYAKTNPFKSNELYSWYMVKNDDCNKSNLRLNSKEELIKSKKKCITGIGISYIDDTLYKEVIHLVEKHVDDDYYHSWEDILFKNNKMILSAKVKNDVYEINTYEELLDLDEKSSALKSEIIKLISNVFNVSVNDINNIQTLKKGMTNRSFIFEIKNKKYIMRIPGEGTDELINRKNEYDTYQVVSKSKICDNVVYINPENGYKITEYINNTRTCNPNSKSDLKKCMSFLKMFHKRQLKVKHEFDLFERILFYEKLFDAKSDYLDYEVTKNNIFKLKEYIYNLKVKKCLTHIDAVFDNFLILKDGDIKLIDWEYAGMQDPHVDIAMFSIYAQYNKKQIDYLIDVYFEGKCSSKTRIKIYAYIAICGLLWSNWCEYKKSLGIEFGDYALKQYRYAKDYYNIVEKELNIK